VIRIIGSALKCVDIVKVAAQPLIVTSEQYFNEAGIVDMSESFQAQFLGLKIKATPKTKLYIRKLTSPILDVSLRAKLGGKAAISVSQFRAFLFPKKGGLEWFLFYLQGKNRNLWVVYAYWRCFIDGYGWTVSANPCVDDNKYGWPANHQVVSRA
jgi:aspartyl-tRNA(Asn)/glutamyl-tRNA(Gln) amidotransferase subunit C